MESGEMNPISTLMQSAQAACSQLSGTIGEYGNPRDRLILHQLCNSVEEVNDATRPTREKMESLQLSLETLRETLQRFRKRYRDGLQSE